MLSRKAKDTLPILQTYVLLFFSFQRPSVTKSLVKCGHLTRSLHLLLKGGASLEVIDGTGETPLHKMHPSIIQGILPQTW